METLSRIGWYFHIIHWWPGHARCEVERNVKSALDLGQLHPQVFSLCVYSRSLLEAWDGLPESITEVVQACLLDFCTFVAILCRCFLIVFIDLENRGWPLISLVYLVLFRKLLGTCLGYFPLRLDRWEHYFLARRRLFIAKYPRDRCWVQSLRRLELNSWMLAPRSLSFLTSHRGTGSWSESSRPHTISADIFGLLLL